MSIEQFKDVNFRAANRALIGTCNTIIADYQGQGLRLTLRQLYYQLVTKNVITNQERSYKNLSNLVSDARLAGLMDWDAIEDRGRRPRMASEWETIQDLVNSALYSYRLPRWEGQENYVELWVEKEALAGVLDPIANEFHVCLMVNKGYSSQSAMYESSKRFIESGDEHEKHLLYLGDHDPSGEDMVRDIEERLTMFGVESLTVRKLALTMAQIRTHNPPPNPTKVTDPRAANYTAQHGTSCWEVDALPPNVLARIIRGALRGLVDQKLMDAVIAHEERDKVKLRKVARDI